jgi:hypothetical protein
VQVLSRIDCDVRAHLERNTNHEQLEALAAACDTSSAITLLQVGNPVCANAPISV